LYLLVRVLTRWCRAANEAKVASKTMHAESRAKLLLGALCSRSARAQLLRAMAIWRDAWQNSELFSAMRGRGLSESDRRSGSPTAAGHVPETGRVFIARVFAAWLAVRAVRSIVGTLQGYRCVDANAASPLRRNRKVLARTCADAEVGIHRLRASRRAGAYRQVAAQLVAAEARSGATLEAADMKSWYSAAMPRLAISLEAASDAGLESTPTLEPLGIEGTSSVLSSSDEASPKAVTRVRTEEIPPKVVARVRRYARAPTFGFGATSDSDVSNDRWC